jgi:ABC-type polysaccharide/polyol phosphate export permease
MSAELRSEVLYNNGSLRHYLKFHILAVPLLVFGQHLSVAEVAPIVLLAVGMSTAPGARLGLKAGIALYCAALLVIICVGMHLFSQSEIVAPAIGTLWSTTFAAAGRLG